MSEHGRCAQDKQLPDVALPHLRDPAEPLPSPLRMLPQGQLAQAAKSRPDLKLSIGGAKA